MQDIAGSDCMYPKNKGGHLALMVDVGALLPGSWHCESSGVGCKSDAAPCSLFKRMPLQSWYEEFLEYCLLLRNLLNTYVIAANTDVMLWDCVRYILWNSVLCKVNRKRIKHIIYKHAVKTRSGQLQQNGYNIRGINRLPHKRNKHI